MFFSQTWAWSRWCLRWGHSFSHARGQWHEDMCLSACVQMIWIWCHAKKESDSENHTSVFVRISCSLLFPVLWTNLFWTVTMIKGKHSSFSDCFACTHACGHYLGVASTCGSTPPHHHHHSQSSEPEYRCVSPEAAPPDTQWRHRCQEVFLATGKGTLGSVVTLLSSLSLFSQLSWFAVLLPSIQ